MHDSLFLPTGSYWLRRQAGHSDRQSEEISEAQLASPAWINSAYRFGCISITAIISITITIIIIITIINTSLITIIVSTIIMIYLLLI